MKTIKASEKITLIPIGKQGENNAVSVLFCVNGWRGQYGDSGTFTLIHRRFGDETPYPVSISDAAEGIRWIVSDVDTAFAGYGECELKYTVGDVVKKSVTWKTKTEEALAPAGDTPPDPFESWYDSILTAGERAEAARTAIEDMTVSGESVGCDEEASVTKTEVGGVVNLHFEIPRGEPGSSAGVTAGDGIEIVGSEISINKAFYDYLVAETFEAPAISLTIAGLSGAHEIGTAVTVSTFSHRETHAQNLVSGSLKLYRESAEIQTVTPSESTVSAALTSPVTEAGTNAGSVTYKLQGTDALGNTRGASVTGAWYRYVYSMVGSPDAAPTGASQCVKQADINSFTASGADFTYTAGSCLWLLTTNQNARIQTNVLGQWADVTTRSAGAVNFTQANGAEATYYAYRTDAFTGSGTAKYRVT